MSKSTKYYVVWEGVEPGVYTSWAACQNQVNGYPGARYKSFSSKAEAEAAFHGAAADYIEVKKEGEKKSTEKKTGPAKNKEIIADSLSVDAACSGNPGKMEYQGVTTSGKEPLFHKAFPLGTNNIGEFLAIVHALAMCKKEEKTLPIYSDSRNAINWVKQKKCKTTLIHNAKTAELHEVIRRAEKWLEDNTYSNKILKWETENWGEIPADFGRK
jgi:ribonuclease HI